MEAIAIEQTYKKGGDTDRPLKLSDIPKSLKNFMPEMQQRAIVGSLEHWEVIERLNKIIAEMPATYQTEKIPQEDKIVWLHYFYGGANWYIIEKDKGAPDDSPEDKGKQFQAFGWASLFGDINDGELGYISIEEIKATNKVELDFYFEPIKLGALLNENKESESSSYRQVTDDGYTTSRGIIEGDLAYLRTEYEFVRKLSGVQTEEQGLAFREKWFRDRRNFYYVAKIEETDDNEIRIEVKNNETNRDIWTREEDVMVVSPTANYKYFSTDDRNFIYGDTTETETMTAQGKNGTSTTVTGEWVDESLLKHVKEQAENLSYDDFNLWYAQALLLDNGADKSLHEGIILRLNLPLNADIQQIYQAARGVAAVPKVNDIPADIPIEEVQISKQNGSLLELYKNSKQSVINNAIRSICKEKGTNRSLYSADEIQFIQLYEGAGGLSKEGEEGARLLDQFFTPEKIVTKMWGLALKHGFVYKNSLVLEPAVGSGRFLKYIPKDSGASVIAYDVDSTAYIICKVVFPDYDIRHGSFESIFFMGRRHIGLVGIKEQFDLVIGNPPYRPYISEYSVLGEKDATRADTFEQYFIMRGVDVLKSGGLLIYIIPNTFLSNDKKYNNFKNVLAAKADLVDAYRLPNNVFSNTAVGTDIIVLRKK
jgi:hypothetical protein